MDAQAALAFLDELDANGAPLKEESEHSSSNRGFCHWRSSSWTFTFQRQRWTGLMTTTPKQTMAARKCVVQLVDTVLMEGEIMKELDIEELNKEQLR